MKQLIAGERDQVRVETRGIFHDIMNVRLFIKDGGKSLKVVENKRCYDEAGSSVSLGTRSPDWPDS